LIDVDQDMLDTTVRRLQRRGLGDRIEARRADAASLPFRDESFDAAFLVAVLGEVADRRGAVRELRRVLHRGARLVIGEVRFDPHAIPADELREHIQSEGFRLDAQVEGRSGHVARFLRA
jgi:ubiquinone/menaquinone biosynthesis C-methylase UbiE